MSELLLSILEHSLSIWDTKEGKAEYSKFLKAKKARDEELDKRAKRLKYSQLTIDKCMRDIKDAARARDIFNKSGK
jgi:hypothetical protein